MIYTCMYDTYMYVCMYPYMYVWIPQCSICVQLALYACMYLYIHVCISTYMYGVYSMQLVYIAYMYVCLLDHAYYLSHRLRPSTILVPIRSTSASVFPREVRGSCLCSSLKRSPRGEFDCLSIFAVNVFVCVDCVLHEC